MIAIETRKHYKKIKMPSRHSSLFLYSTEMAEESDKTIASNTLAPVQRQCLEFLTAFIADRGYAPTLKEIADHIGVRSASTAHFHLERLVTKGFIERGEDGEIRLVHRSRPVRGNNMVPLCGVIAAGVPIEAVEQSAWAEVPSDLISGRGEVYCLEVSGDSMIEAHICDGDLVVIRRQEDANDGDIVVAVLDDGSTTLKTLRRLRDGRVMLVPANSRLQPITLPSVTVRGKLIGVIRKLH